MRITFFQRAFFALFKNNKKNEKKFFDIFFSFCLNSNYLNELNKSIILFCIIVDKIPKKSAKKCNQSNIRKYLILATCTQHVLNVLLQRWLRRKSKCQYTLSTHCAREMKNFPH